VAPSHTFAKAGTYTVGLTVTDSSGLTPTVTKPIAVATSAKITGVKVKKIKKKTYLLITVSGPGTIQIGGKTIHIARAGTVKFQVKLSKAQTKRLKKKHKLNDKLTIKFLPTIGPPTQATKTVKFKG
jgi:PKD repeat protein